VLLATLDHSPPFKHVDSSRLTKQLSI
jgi:hypothetical protein